MTAPWRRLRSLVWEYWAGLLVCAFWIPDSRGMPHVIRIGKGSPEPRVSVRPGGGGNGAAEHDPKRFCQPLRAAGPCDHKELFLVRTKFQARVTGLTYYGGGNRAEEGEGPLSRSSEARPGAE